MCARYSLTKFANFLIIVLRVEIVTIFEPKVVTISARNTILRKFAGGNRPLALMCRDEWSSRGHKQIDSFQT